MGRRSQLGARRSQHKAMDNVVGTQADIGARMNVMESARTQLRDADVVNQTARAELADVDYNEAVTELVKNETYTKHHNKCFRVSIN